MKGMIASYLASPGGQEAIQNYLSSPEGKKAICDYIATPQGKQTVKELLPCIIGTLPISPEDRETICASVRDRD
jgi:hypothetical protein